MKIYLSMLTTAMLLMTATECAALHEEDADAALLSRSTQDYWNGVYPPEIPRAFDVHRDGCPVCGEAIKKHGMYAWIIDPAKPFKVKCPECGTVFPDNDFEAYWKSGFKDKSLLTGKYVDDGRGWRPAEGKPKYWFVAYYNHWNMYQDTKPDGTDSYRLARAYRRTGNPEYARRALAILDHLADNYSKYDYNKQSRYAEEVYKHYKGRYVNAIWESLFTNLLADAYYWTRDFLKSDDQELLSVTGKTAVQMRKNIEDNLFRVIANDIVSMNGKNSGNFGMHQRTLLKAARILGDKSLARWVTDFRVNSRNNLPLDYVLYNSIYSDGAPVESPGYNSLWLDTIHEMFVLLEENGVNEFALHKVSKHLFNYPLKLVACGKFTPSSGDSGYLENISPNFYMGKHFQRLREHSPLEYNRLLNDYGYSSHLLPSYGFANLQNSNKEAPTSLVLAFPSYYGHRHSDTMHIDFFAENAALMPDFGYPDSASNDDPERTAFYLNTVSHNTVVVNRRKQGYRASLLNRFDTGGFAQYVAANCPGIYNGVSKYSRSLLVCETAPGKTIVFDVFRVKGGTQHDWFVHSAGESFMTDIPLEAQKTGTLAGPDVEYGRFYDNAAMQAMMSSNNKNFNGYTGSGFQYLYDVKHGQAKSGQHVLLPADKGKTNTPNPGAALKVYLLDEGERISLSHGRPPRTQGNLQKHVVFLNRRRTGTAPLSSAFSTVFEPVSALRANYDAKNVSRLAAGIGTEAAKVEFKDGRLLYVFIADDVAEFEADGIVFKGNAGAVLLNPSTGKGKAFVAGPGEISYKGRTVVSAGVPFEATISEVLLEDESIVLDRDIPEEMAGRMFRVGSYAYRISAVDGRKLSLLDQSMLRGRGRILKYASEDHKSGQILPAPMLAANGMALYKGDDKATFVSRPTSLAGGKVVSDTKLELGRDYWISECTPGDKASIPMSHNAVFDM